MSNEKFIAYEFSTICIRFIFHNIFKYLHMRGRFSGVLVVTLAILLELEASNNFVASLHMN